MSWETASDRLAILTACGGTTATIGEGSAVGVLESDYAEVQGIESRNPIFTCRTADVASVVHGTAITIDGTSYTVRSRQDDGTGITALVLSE